LPERLQALRGTLPEGVLHFRTDGAARYEDFDRVLATLKRERVERLGFVGNERFSGAIAR
jgi:biopolymer transport protein ExbD